MKRSRPASMLVRVILRHIEGIAWRRLRVPSTMTLAEIDEMLCLAFDLPSGAPRQIRVAQKTYESRSSPFPAPNTIDDTTVTIGEVAKRGTDLLWRYDWIGERWEHDITVEDARANAAPELMVPSFVEGGGMVPTFSNHISKATFESCKVDAKIRARFGIQCPELPRRLPAPVRATNVSTVH